MGKTRNRFWSVLVGLSLWSLVAARSAYAEEITFDEALDLGELIPAVSAVQDRLRARQQGDVRIGGAAGPTQLLFLPGALVWPREDQGFDMQATITQSWNLRNLGGAREKAAENERAVLGAEARAAALRGRLAAAHRWIEVATLARVARSLESRIAEAEELVARRARALEGGVGTTQAWVEARAALALLRQRRLDLEGDEFDSSLRLALAVGREPGSERLVAAGPMPNPDLPDEVEIRAQIKHVDAAPDVLVTRLREISARARALEVEAGYAPLLTAGAQIERSVFETWIVYGVTGVSFAGAGGRRRWVSNAQAQAAGAGAKSANVRLQARAELEEALHQLIHTAGVVKLLEEDTLPALHRLVTARQKAVAVGEQSVFALSQARDRELAATAELHRARGAHTWAKVQMWLLLAELSTRESLSAGSPP